MRSVVNGKSMIALRVTKSYVFFFNLEGKWTRLTTKEAYKEGIGNVFYERHKYVAIAGVTGLSTEIHERHVLTLLRVGDSFERYEELLKTEPIGVVAEGLDRFIIKYDYPPRIGRISTNGKVIGIRYVFVYMWVYEYWKDKEQFVMDNADEIIRRTTEWLSNQHLFKRLNIPIEDLEVKRIALTSSTRLQVYYEPKEKQ